jgi:archaeal type IV pilus assembly protein PilA
MDFKKLFRKDDKAVSPVIGVILMVAITVILAAAIGSSVFSHGTAQSAPQANLDLKSGGVSTSGIASVRIEHLGGETIHFEDAKITKITASLDNGPSYTIAAANNAVNATTAPGLGVFDVGSVKTLALANADGTNAFTGVTPAAGNTVHIKVIDVQTNQLICDKDVRL